MAHANPILVSVPSFAAILAALAFAVPALADTTPTGAQTDAAAVHATLEDAALDALDTLRADRAPATRGRLRVGRIVSVDGGYVWEAPAKAAPGVRPVVRLRSGPDHVATFLARPNDSSSSDRALAREWQRREQALVDVHDRLHRPLYVLTGKGEIVVYRSNAEPVGTPIAAR